MRIPLYQVDAFTDRVFGGNPAAVCPLEHWLPDAVLQGIAAENNISETAYLVPATAEDAHDFHIRWFTPTTEVDLCGHATLASAWVIFQHLDVTMRPVRFASRSGMLSVAQDESVLTLDFPAQPTRSVDCPPELAAALGCTPEAVRRATTDFLVVLGTEAEIVALRPDFRRLAQLDGRGVIVTAPGTDCDFVSRFFAPAAGIDEDPVTGSAHCTLTPYWAARLDKTELRARQRSERGGDLLCRLAGDRVHISGHAVTYLQGSIEVPTQ